MLKVRLIHIRLRQIQGKTSRFVFIKTIVYYIVVHKFVLLEANINIRNN